FAQMCYAVTCQAAWLGAEDGIVGVSRPRLAGLDLGDARRFHLYLIVLVALAALALWRIVQSPFGHVLRGIRENEARMQAVGYAGGGYKVLAFVLAGALARPARPLYPPVRGSIHAGWVPG